jgi:hypothetical protein
LGIGSINVSQIWRATKPPLKGPPITPAATPARTNKKNRWIWIVCACWSAILLINLCQWLKNYEPVGVWIPSDLDASVSGEYGEALLHVTEVSQNGQVVCVKFACDTMYTETRLRVQYSGLTVDYPTDTTSSETNVDCLMSPSFMSGYDKVLAGTNLLHGKPFYRIGFVLPDAATAAKVVEQVKQVNLNKPRGLDQNKCVLDLFQLRRLAGKKSDGKTVPEYLTAMLIWGPINTFAANSKPTAVQNLSFGQVILLYGPVTNQNLPDFTAVNLVAGQVKAFPKSVIEQDSLSGNKAAAYDWMESQGMDIANFGDDGLVGLEMAMHTLKPDDWENYTARWLTDSLSNTPISSHIILEPLFLNSVTNYVSAFKNRKSREGLLQITGFTGNPRGVKLRYKLVQNSVTTATPQTSEPADLREAKAKLAELEIDYDTNNPTAQRQLARIKELERLTHEEPNTPADLREAKTKLAESHVDYAEQNPTVQRALARVNELERMTKEEPDAPADLREAKAHLAELRVDYAEQNPLVQEALARIKALEAK